MSNARLLALNAKLREGHPCCLVVGETTFLSGSLKGTADLISLVGDFDLRELSREELTTLSDGLPFEVGLFAVRGGIVSRYVLDGSKVTEADAPILVTGVGTNAPDIIPRLEEWCKHHP